MQQIIFHHLLLQNGGLKQLWKSTFPLVSQMNLFRGDSRDIKLFKNLKIYWVLIFSQFGLISVNMPLLDLYDGDLYG